MFQLRKSWPQCAQGDRSRALSPLSTDASVPYAMKLIGFDGGTNLGWALLEYGPRGVAEFLEGGVLRVEATSRLICEPRDLIARLGLGPGSIGGVESVIGKAHAEGDLKKAAAKSRNLIHASRVSEACAQSCAHAGMAVESFPAVESRLSVVGSSYPSDAEIRYVAKLRIQKIPAGSAHVVDAAIAALYAGLRNSMGLIRKDLAAVTPSPTRGRSFGHRR